MSSFIVKGGNPLNGRIRPSGNKNEALPALTACLLTKEPITFSRVPRIKDVLTMCEILADLGVHVHWQDDETLTLCSGELTYKQPHRDLCEKIRASILFLGPMLGRFGKVNLPLPGGDVIGARRIDTHFESIETLGGIVELKEGEIAAHVDKIVGTALYLDEPSVTATENALLLSVLGEGTTKIYNAACEPHVVGLCRLLNAMGASIKGVGSNCLEITGVTSLHEAKHKIGPDFMEVGSFMCLGSMGGGQITIEDIEIDDLRFILKIFQKIGIQFSVEGNAIKVDGRTPATMKTEVSSRIGTIYSGPWPAFPTDLMSVAIVAATQARGTMIFHEKMFEGRMFFTDKLLAMGANIVLCDPHRVVVNGESPLKGTRMSSPDVRAGMAMLMAAVVAQGTSKIDNIYQIERGYYNIEEKLRSLGTSIEKI